MLLGVVGGVVVVLVYKDGEKFLCKFFPYLRHNQRIGQLSKPYLQPCLNQGPRIEGQVSSIMGQGSGAEDLESRTLYLGPRIGVTDWVW